MDKNKLTADLIEVAAKHNIAVLACCIMETTTQGPVQASYVPQTAIVESIGISRGKKDLLTDLVMAPFVKWFKDVMGVTDPRRN